MDEEERIRAELDRLCTDASGRPRPIEAQDVVSALAMERRSHPELSNAVMAQASGLGESTISGWIVGSTNPSLTAVRRLVEGLHPSGPKSDYLQWLLAGRAYRDQLRQELASLERARRHRDVGATIAADLDGQITAEGVLDWIARQPDREGILRQLRDLLTELEGDDHAPRPPDPGRSPHR